MKTIEDMLEKAFSIADNDPNAFVGVFCVHAEAQHALSQMDYLNGRFIRAQMLYESNSNGRVRVITANRPQDICGYQFSHVFLADYVADEMKQFVKSRVRSVYKHPVKMGVYHQSGIVEYVEAW